MTSTLLQTIRTDLAAGMSYLEKEAESAGLFLWNTLKGAFVALEPAEAAILTDVLGTAVGAAAGGKTIEQIETDALNTATVEQKAVLVKAGSGIVQTVIAGIKASQAPTAGG